MKIRVLGMGCPRCGKLYENARKALEDLEIEDLILEKVEDLSVIAEMGAMLTPALALDEEIVVSGRVPSPGEIRKLLEERL